MGRKCKEEYLEGKRRVKSAAYFSNKSAHDKKIGDLNYTEQHNLIFRMACKMKDDNKDITGEKCVKDQERNMVFHYNSKATARWTHYSPLLNAGFTSNHDNLSGKPAVHGPPIFITEEMICQAISLMKTGKGNGPSGVALETILASQWHTVPHLTKLANNTVTEGKITEDWNLYHIINCYKGRGDQLVMGNYCGLKLLDHIMKIIEHAIKSIIRSSFNINEMQYVFMPGCGTMDAIFILRQMHQKNIFKNISHYILLLQTSKSLLIKCLEKSSGGRCESWVQSNGKLELLLQCTLMLHQVSV